ncbi:MAG: hypothetical protein Q8K88_12500, partial [Bradyrhizobium sp.]|nr:hypothetical protein [Bradyrhizobium sp.]
MNLQKSLQIPAIASLSSPQFGANPFLLLAAMYPIYRPQLTSTEVSYRWRRRRHCVNLPVLRIK